MSKSAARQAFERINPLFRIESVEDPRVAPYRDMKERTARGENIFITEGLLLAERLLRSRFETESVFVSDPFTTEVEPLVGPDVPLYVASEAVLQAIVGFPFHRGVLAVGRRGDPLALEDLLSNFDARSPRCLVVCPHVNQSENMGLIFRTAAAFGVDGLLLGPQSADPFSRRCLRLSMGGSLVVPFATSHDLAGDLLRLKNTAHLDLVATVLDAHAESVANAPWSPRTALLLGNEFEGLSSEYLAICDRRLTIPMRPGTDSLNVGVAAGIFLYEWRNHAS